MPGRRGYLEEKTKREILRLSACTILKALRDTTLDLKFRADLAKDLVAKNIGEGIDRANGAKQIIFVLKEDGRIGGVESVLEIQSAPKPENNSEKSEQV